MDNRFAIHVILQYILDQFQEYILLDYFSHLNPPLAKQALIAQPYKLFKSRYDIYIDGLGGSQFLMYLLLPLAYL